jgi:hypothetical protein
MDVSTLNASFVSVIFVGFAEKLYCLDRIITALIVVVKLNKLKVKRNGQMT